MDNITFKYKSKKELPQLVHENITNIGYSRIDEHPMFTIDFVGKLERVSHYIINHDGKTFQRKLKLNKLLGLQYLDELYDYEIAIINFIIDENEHMEYIGALEDHLPTI